MAIANVQIAMNRYAPTGSDAIFLYDCNQASGLTLGQLVQAVCLRSAAAYERQSVTKMNVMAADTAVLVDASADTVREFFQFVCAVAHTDAGGGVLDHFEVVRSIAKGNAVLVGHAGRFEVARHAGGFVDAGFDDLAVAELRELVRGVHDLEVVAEFALDVRGRFRALEVAALLDVRVVLRVFGEGCGAEDLGHFVLRDAEVPERLEDDVEAVLFGENAG